MGLRPAGGLEVSLVVPKGRLAVSMAQLVVRMGFAGGADESAAEFLLGYLAATG
ncbi:hypothetical protein [Kribbella deserti]|uniref:Uncharacterized protein n=1 Tax=Kribbella deserti TaxID=1926257 RepID=A0ABV6QKR3_9ACTN